MTQARGGMGLAVLGLVVATGCADDHQRPELRAALDAASLSLIDSIGTALEQTQTERAQQARFVMTDANLFAVKAVDVAKLREVKIDSLSGTVVGMNEAGNAISGCDGQIALTDALAIAEAEAGGDAVQSVPDDDVDCAFEIQVLVDETLWEVKLGPDGAVLEKELSDEFGGGDDD